MVVLEIRDALGVHDGMAEIPSIRGGNVAVPEEVRDEKMAVPWIHDEKKADPWIHDERA